MRKTAFLLLALCAAGPAWAQVSCNQGLEPIDRQGETRITPNDFIKTIAANEVVITKALGTFGYTLQITYQTLQGDQVDGEFRQTLKVSFEGNTRRIEPVGGTVNTLSRVKAPTVNVDALNDAFTLTPDLIARRDIVFSGRQKVDDFSAHVFDVLPRDNQAANGFSGRTWVRGRNNEIARFCGRMEDGPFGGLRYLVQRAWVADKYWFPVHIQADETIRVNGNEVHVRVEVKYSDYAAR